VSTGIDGYTASVTEFRRGNMHGNCVSVEPISKMSGLLSLNQKDGGVFTGGSYEIHSNSIYRYGV